MKYQILFSLKNNEKVFINVAAAVLNGTLRVTYRCIGESVSNQQGQAFHSFVIIFEYVSKTIRTGRLFFFFYIYI